MDETGREREKKILVPNSVHTRPRQEISKKNSKKIQKIKNPLSGNISSQNWMIYDGKGRKIFQARIPLILDPGMKIPKKIAKKFKKSEKPLSSIIFSQNGIREAEKARKKF